MKLRIVSDGTAHGTIITNAETGEIVENCTSLHWYISRNAQAAIVTVTFREMEVDLVGETVNSETGACEASPLPDPPTKIPPIPVVSSNIASLGYDEPSQTLEVVFTNGGRYRYGDVSQKVYDDLIGAESIGKQFAQSIKGQFKFSGPL